MEESAIRSRVGLVCKYEVMCGQCLASLSQFYGEELTMTGEGIESGELPTTMFTLEWLDTAMQLHMSLAIVLACESCR